MDFKESKAPKTTITYNRKDIAAKTENIYEAIKANTEFTAIQ